MDRQARLREAAQPETDAIAIRGGDCPQPGHDFKRFARGEINVVARIDSQPTREAGSRRKCRSGTGADGGWR
jgi:hypothetical protein